MMAGVSQLREDTNSEFAHNQCVYVGNHAGVKRNDIDVLIEELNRL